MLVHVSSKKMYISFESTQDKLQCGTKITCADMKKIMVI